jgi:hypothetical protein
MRVDRRILKSVSEFSVFKYVLVAYLVFFILYVIIFSVVGLVGWALLASSGVTFQDLLNTLMPGLNINQILGGLGLNLGSGALGIIIFIIIGLVASVFSDEYAALTTWIFNVVLRIIGGVELRFAPIRTEFAEQYSEQKPEQTLKNYQINH